MKKTIICAVILSLIIPFTACDKTKSEENNSIEILDMDTHLCPWEYPVIDGSSSTVTMHAAIRAHLTGEYIVEDHSQTYAALERLIPGSDNPADVLLAVKYYDNTLLDAKNRGADLVITPIAKEGFVFITHPDNPIDSLTQEQLRAIYSGKITNWKEVGGKDEEIKPLNRNLDSGSQTAMEDFMGGLPMVEGATMIGSMGLMIDSIAMTGSAAIGYNIYSWATKQGVGVTGLTLMAVDGVSPSDETLADSSYPLMIYTYSYYNKDNDKGRAHTEWLLTAVGQKVIVSAGYVGIFGEMPQGWTPDFNRDGSASEITAINFYAEKDFSNWTGYERISDRAQTEKLSNGKGKNVTVLYLFYYDSIPDDEIRSKNTRFIVLTREKNGAFEVINEGEVLSYENGVITPGVENISLP